jgi:protein-S-isoprenylcysteine O-methyltransferase Ste14
METNLENKSIEIGQESLNHLNTTRKWAMFLAIMGFIFLGIMLLFGVIAGVFLSAFKDNMESSGLTGIIMGVFFVIMAAVYFFPLLYLFRFSKHIAAAVQTLSKDDLYKAFKNLKSYFVYIGVLIIVMLSVYVVVLIVAGTSMAFLKGL